MTVWKGPDAYWVSDDDDLIDVGLVHEWLSTLSYWAQNRPRLTTEKAMAHLRRIPTIVLDYPTVESWIVPTIRFTTAVYGIHRPGTAYRMDGVPIPLRAFLASDYPSDCEVLKQIEDQFLEA